MTLLLTSLADSCWLLAALLAVCAAGPLVDPLAGLLGTDEALSCDCCVLNGGGCDSLLNCLTAIF